MTRELSPERRREIGNSKGGRARVPKGLATMSAAKRKKIQRLALEARWRKKAEREAKVR